MKSNASHLLQVFGARLKTQTPLAPYTYIKIGGPAEYLLVVNQSSELISAVSNARLDHLPVTLLGAGSNIVISDQGLKGLVIINRAQAIQPVADSHLLVDSGTLISQLVNYCLEHNLAGLAEFLGLPGTVGGAIVNNSHHLNYLIGDLVYRVTAVKLDGTTGVYSKVDCRFAYDSSIFQTEKAVVVTVEFALQPGQAAEITKTAQQALTRRRQTQPLDQKSSGCMFKNPPKPQPSAGFMIDSLGLKGKSVGGAQVSQVHANFIINTGTATARDIVALSNLVRQKVFERYQIRLEREIFFLGAHPNLEG